ncbi:MAG: hypothetical protein AAF957_22450 [Planctomycetota bacterium]
MPRPTSHVWTPLLVCALLRVALGSIARSGGLWGDEAAYLRHAIAYAETGLYVGHWPPLYVWFLGTCVRLFGDHGEGVARLLQVGMAVWTCGWVGWMAGRAFGRRAGLCASWMFALYLPLAALGHRLLSETLYLALLVPAVALLVEVFAGRVWMAWAAPAGVLFGLALLTRDVGLPTLGALVVAIPIALRPRGADALRRAGLVAAAFALWAAAVVTPWSVERGRLRPDEGPSGGTAVANLRQGLTPGHDSFELRRLGPRANGPPDGLRMRLLEVPDSDAVRRARGGNLADVLALVRDEPTYVARVRVVRWADLVSPLSPALTGWYSRIYARDGVPDTLRWLLIALAVACPVGLATAATVAILRVRAPRALLVPSLAVFAVTVATGLLVAQSRFRAPALPFAIVLVSGLAAARAPAPQGRAPWAIAFGASLVGGWAVAFRPLEAALLESW